MCSQAGLESSQSQVQLSPEEGASQAIDEEAQGCVDGHEEAGHVGEDNKPEDEVSKLLFLFVTALAAAKMLSHGVFNS